MHISQSITFIVICFDHGSQLHEWESITLPTALLSHTKMDIKHTLTLPAPSRVFILLIRISEVNIILYNWTSGEDMCLWTKI